MMERDQIREALSDLKKDVKEGFLETRSDLTQVKKDIAQINLQNAVMELQIKGIVDSQKKDLDDREDLAKRVSDLESFKYKLLGGMTAGSAIVSIIVSVVMKLLG